MNGQLSLNVFAKMLQIIGYEGDPALFLRSFAMEAGKLAFLQVRNSLSQEKLEEFDKQMKATKDPQEVQKILFAFVTPQVYTNILRKKCQDIFAHFLQSQEPHLSQEQKDNLQAYSQQVMQQYNLKPFIMSRRDA